MHRFTLLALLAACSSQTTARPPVTNVAPATRYALQPVRLAGPYGRHSSIQTSALVRGDLALHSTHATLDLETTWEVGFVYCDQAQQTRQQCADPAHDKPSSTTKRERFTGEARWSEGRMVARLATPERAVTLHCTQTHLGLTCTMDGNAHVYAYPDHDSYAVYVFATPTTKRFALARTQFGDSPVLEGELAITGETAILHLSADGGPPVERRGTISRAGAALIVQTGGPVGRVFLRCPEADARLACEITVDPEVFHRPAFWGAVELVDVNARANAPVRAQAPMRAASAALQPASRAAAQPAS